LHDSCARNEASYKTSLCLGIEYLIKVKRAAGRPKDFEAIAELEAILEERQQANNQNLKANSSSQQPP